MANQRQESRPPSTLEQTQVPELRRQLRGPALLPAEPGYDVARTVWNAMIDRYPGIIVQAHAPSDIMAGVDFARYHDLEIAVRGGGHNVAGNAVCEGGLMLDLSAMKSVRVDPAARTAHVEPGALLQDLDRETQAHGLATPTGFISETGVSGLTLGGGFGYLSRKWGLTVDNLRAVDMVTAEGKWVRANEAQNPDLFWGIRGGGGNFGIVTSFEFDLHKLGPQVLAGPVVHDFRDAPGVLRQVDDALQYAPKEVSCLAILRHAPPLPFIPEPMHGKMILLLALIHAGDPVHGEAALAPFRAIGNPVADRVAPRPYTAFQSQFDASASQGARNYWKAHYLQDLDDEGIDTLCVQAARMTSKESVIGMLTMGGAVAEQPPESTPYTHRDATWALNIQSRWREPDEDDHHIGWCREAFEAMKPFATGGVYVNFLSGGEGDARLRAAYGDRTYQRLAEVKRTWDPENLFHLNQNIQP